MDLWNVMIFAIIAIVFYFYGLPYVRYYLAVSRIKKKRKVEELSKVVQMLRESVRERLNKGEDDLLEAEMFKKGRWTYAYCPHCEERVIAHTLGEKACPYCSERFKVVK